MAALTEHPEALAPEQDERGLPDLPFMLLTVLLVVIGVIMLFSASYASAYADPDIQSSSYYFVRQGGFALAGIAAMWFISRINYQAFRFFSVFILAGSILLLAMVPVIGLEENGAKRWIRLFGINFQPSELAKVGVVMIFATLMSVWRDRMRTFRYGVAPYLGILAVIALLLYIERHLSATLIIFMTGAVMMLLGGTSKRWLIGLAIVAVGLIAIYLLTRGYTGDRIKAWLHPEEFASDEGYQVIQSQYAIGSGGLTGLGFGKSRQKYLYLPEEHNDYIFAIVCEELGFIGASVIVLLFGLLVLRGYWISMHAHDRFGALLSAGLTTLIGLQVLLNIGVVTNLLPSTGISLPFFSYGGTALLVNLAEMGMILSVSRQNTNRMVVKRRKKRSKAR